MDDLTESPESDWFGRFSLTRDNRGEKSGKCGMILGMKMRKNKYILILLGILVLSVFMTACQPAYHGKSEHEPLLFGATYMTRNNSYFDVLHEAIEEVVEGNGDILISRNPCQDQEKQNEQILEMIDEGIQVLFLNPVDWEKVKPALQACKEAGVVVIDVDTVVKDKEYVVSIIETDNYEAGRLCALDMMERVDQAKIVIVGNPIQTSIMNRVRGFTDAIEGKKQYQIVKSIVGAGELEVSAENMSKLIQEGEEFDVVLGGNDPSALGALASLQQHEKDQDVLIYGIDGSPDFKGMLALGYVAGTAAQSPKTIGTVAAQTAYAYLAGEEISEYISITPYMITRNNYREYELNGWQ